MSPKQRKFQFGDEEHDEAGKLQQPLGLRFAKRVKQIGRTTQFTTKARHAERRQNQARGH